MGRPHLRLDWRPVTPLPPGVMVRALLLRTRKQSALSFGSPRRGWQLGSSPMQRRLGQRQPTPWTASGARCSGPAAWSRSLLVKESRCPRRLRQPPRWPAAACLCRYRAGLAAPRNRLNPVLCRHFSRPAGSAASGRRGRQSGPTVVRAAGLRPRPVSATALVGSLRRGVQAERRSHPLEVGAVRRSHGGPGEPVRGHDRHQPGVLVRLATERVDVDVEVDGDAPAVTRQRCRRRRTASPAG